MGLGWTTFPFKPGFLDMAAASLEATVFCQKWILKRCNCYMYEYYMYDSLSLSLYIYIIRTYHMSYIVYHISYIFHISYIIYHTNICIHILWYLVGRNKANAQFVACHLFPLCLLLRRCSCQTTSSFTLRSSPFPRITSIRRTPQLDMFARKTYQKNRLSVTILSENFMLKKTFYLQESLDVFFLPWFWNIVVLSYSFAGDPLPVRTRTAWSQRLLPARPRMQLIQSVQNLKITARIGKNHSL